LTLSSGTPMRMSRSPHREERGEENVVVLITQLLPRGQQIRGWPTS